MSVRSECPSCGMASVTGGATTVSAADPEGRKAFLSASAFVVACPRCSRKRRRDRPLAYVSEAGSFAVAWFPPDRGRPDERFLRAVAAGLPAGSTLRYTSDWERATEAVRILERGFSDRAVRILGIGEAEALDPEADAFGWHFVAIVPGGSAVYANRKRGESRALARAEELFRALGDEFARACPEGSWTEVADGSDAETLASLPWNFRLGVVEGGRR